MQHTCAGCEKPFESPYRTAKYCSRDCVNKYRYTSIDRSCRKCGAPLEKPGQIKLWYCSIECRDTDPNRTIIDGMVHTSCKQCGKDFTHPVWRTNDYCSRQCADKCLKNSEIITSNCEYCEKPFQHKNTHPRRFCSKKCWHTHAVGENNPTWNSVETECGNCHKHLVRQPHRIEGAAVQFCCAQCKGDYYAKIQVGPNHPLWKGGAYSNRGKGWYTQRRLAWIRDNYTCQACGKTRKQTGKKPHVHHIIPFRLYGLDRAEEANQLTNLVCLCSGCHMKAEYGLITFQLPLI